MASVSHRRALLQVLQRQLASCGFFSESAIESAQQPINLCRTLCTSSGRWMNAQPQQDVKPEEESPSAQQQDKSSSEQHEHQQQNRSTAEDGRQRVFSAFHSGYSHFRNSARNADPQQLLGMMAKEVQDVFRPSDKIRSATRLYTGPVLDVSASGGVTALQAIPQQQTTWQKLHERLMGLPFFSRFSAFRLSDTAAYKKGQEVMDDLKDKYETSDHPAVHKVDEYKQRILSGSESSRAMLEIRARDPNFDMNTFVRAVKLDGPVVVNALLHKDLQTLALHMGPEMMERLAGIFNHEKGWYDDPNILFVSDVEIVEVRMLDDDPFVVAQFHCQQIQCTRDKFGNVVEGSPDAIQRVYYFWGLQQEKVGVITADGEVLPPRWVIRDLMWKSMLALV